MGFLKESIIVTLLEAEGKREKWRQRDKRPRKLVSEREVRERDNNRGSERERVREGE